MDPIYTAATQSSDLPVVAIFFLIVLYVGIIGLMLWVYAKIVAKTGYPWPWIFIMFVPIANIVFLCMFAFKPWPIEQELAATRAALQAATGSPNAGGQFGGQFGGGFGGGYGGQPGGYVEGGYQGGYQGGQVPPPYQGGFDQDTYGQGGFGGGYPQGPQSGNPYAPKG